MSVPPGPIAASKASVGHPTGVGFRWLIAAASAATYALVVLGGVVRATESGLGCPDWPRCHGQLLPPLETPVLIEFSHRLLASIVGLLVLATAFVAWRRYRQLPAVVWPAMAALVLVIGQIILGGVTVLNDLSPSIVSAHLALALSLLAALLIVAVFAFSPPAGASARDTAASPLRNLTLLTALASFGVMLTGSYVSGSGASLAFGDWPLFNGQLLPDGGRLAMIHFTHRLAAAAGGVLVVFLAVRAWRLRRWDWPITSLATLAVVLYGAQVLVGAANIWTLLEPPARVAHLALAAALWGTLVVVTLLLQRAAVAPTPAPEERRALGERLVPQRGEAAGAGMPVGRPS